MPNTSATISKVEMPKRKRGDGLNSTHRVAVITMGHQNGKPNHQAVPLESYVNPHRDHAGDKRLALVSSMGWLLSPQPFATALGHMLALGGRVE